MTISNTPRKAGPYAGNGSATTFAFAFKVFSAADVLVVRADTATGIETTLTLTTDYTVSLNADQDTSPGGTITTTTAPATGQTITLSSDMDYTQPVELTNNGGFYPRVINDALDRLTIGQQQLKELTDRTLKVAVSTPSVVDTTLPAPEANKLIGWNPTADNLQNMDPTTLATIVAFGTANADKFSGDGSTVNFSLSANPGALNSLDVAIGGSTKIPGIDYTWSGGTTITFTTAPPSGTNNILVRYMQGLPSGITTASAVSIADAGDYFPSAVSNVELAIQNLAASRVVSTMDPRFGAVGDKVADDTAAVQAAIDAAQGGIVMLGRRHRIAGTLALTVAGGHKGTVLQGRGIGGSELYFDNGALDCITVTGTDTGANQFNGFTLRDVTITHGTKTGGRTFVTSFSYRVKLDTVLIENCWCGIEGYVVNNFNLYDVNIQGVVGGGNAPAYLGPVAQAPLNCYGVFFHAPSDGSYRSDALRAINVTVQASFSGADGFLWDGGATTVDAYQFTMLSCDYGIRIRNTGASNANYPQFGEFVNCNTDGAKTTGLRIEGGAGMHFTGCNLMNTSGISGQGNADTNAVTILPDETGSYTRAITFTGCNLNNCRQDVVSASARDLKFVGCDFHDGGKAASNTYSGLVIGADAEDVIVSGCSFSRYGSNNNFKHGISVAAGSVRILVDGNYIFNAQTKPINWLNTDSNSRCYNNVSESKLHQDIGRFCNVKSADLSAGNVTLTGSETLSGIVMAINAGVARDLTLATAAQIVAQLQNPMLGAMFEITVINTGSATVSIAGGAGLTMSGNTSASKYPVTSGSARRLLMRIGNLGSGTEAVAVYG